MINRDTPPDTEVTGGESEDEYIVNQAKRMMETPSHSDTGGKRLIKDLIRKIKADGVGKGNRYWIERLTRLSPKVMFELSKTDRDANLFYQSFQARGWARKVWDAAYKAGMNHRDKGVKG